MRGEGMVIGTIDSGLRHRCGPPGWWKRWHRKMQDGLVWECLECGRQYELDHKSPQSGFGVHYHGSRHWPWMDMWPYRLNSDGHRYLSSLPPSLLRRDLQPLKTHTYETHQSQMPRPQEQRTTL